MRLQLESGLIIQAGATDDTVIIRESSHDMGVVLLEDEIDEVFEAINKCLADYRRRQAERTERRMLDDWNNGRGIGPGEQLKGIERLVKDDGFEASDFLVMVACPACDHEHYFEPDEQPGGDEHCEYCESCAAKLDEDKLAAWG